MRSFLRQTLDHGTYEAMRALSVEFVFVLMIGPTASASRGDVRARVGSRVQDPMALAGNRDVDCSRILVPLRLPPV